MKRVVATLVVILLWPGCDGMFLPPLARGISSILGTNNEPVQDGASVIAALRSGQNPDFTGHIPVVVGTTNQLRQIQERWPVLSANAQFRETDAVEPGRIAQRPLLPFVPHGSLDFGMPWNSGAGHQDAKLRSNVQTSHIRAYAQPIEEPEAPAPAYGKPASRPEPSYNKPVSSYPRPEPSYGKPAPSYPKPASNYPKPEVSPGYGKPEPPTDAEPQPVPEAGDLPAVNDDSSSWNHETATNEIFTQTVNNTSSSQTASSSSSSASITQTASISNSAQNSATHEPSSQNQEGENNIISVLQDVSIQQTEANQSNTDFFQPQLPAAQTNPSFTSDNVIRPASRPPSTPNQEPVAEDGQTAENPPNSSSAESEISQTASSSQTSGSDSNSIVQEASIEQNANDGTAPIPAPAEGSSSETNPPFVSDNVIRPASRPVSSSDAPASSENDESNANSETNDPASSGASAEIVQSASAGDGSVVQDASIEQSVDDGASGSPSAPSETSESASSSQASSDAQSAQTAEDSSDSNSNSAIEQNASSQQHETPTGTSDSSDSNSEAQEQGQIAHEQNTGNAPLIDDGADVFVTNHSHSESSFNETKTTHNRTEHISTTIISSLPGPVVGADHSVNQQIPAKKLQHPFLGQAQKLLSNKIMKPGFPRLLRRSADDADLIDSPQSSVEAEEVVDEVEDGDGELDLSQFNDSYAVLTKESDIEEYFNQIADKDKDHCIAKFICEIAVNPKKYKEAGKQIEDFFGNYDTSHSRAGMKLYKEAFATGRAGKEACLAKFPECAHEDLDDGPIA